MAGAMKMDTAVQKVDLHSLDITDVTRTRLKGLFPEVFTEGGKIDFDRLKLSLGEAVDVGKERYGMNWPGKADCFRTVQEPSVATLVPDRRESVNFDDTENIFIEGDNLEVLKLLQKSYFGKIKMIYIDPPYNTGNDFIYPDKYAESLDTYLRYTGQIDDEGRKYSTNSETDGRFHSRWMNMIYPRVFLARNLLSNDGAMFVNIGEQEVGNLQKICDEIFGEENRVSIIARVAKTASDMGSFFAPSIDFVLCYAKDKDSLAPFKDEVDESLYKKTEFDGERKGERYRDDVALYQSSLTLERSRNARYYIDCPDGSRCIPPEKKRWRVVEETFLAMKTKVQIVFKETKTSPLFDAEGKQSKWNIYTKSYLKDRLVDGTLPRNFLDDFINRKGADLIKKYGIDFEFSKPVELMEYFLDIMSLKENDVVLDFFAGSASTAHSVINKNVKSRLSLKYIMVQLPEPLDDATRVQNKGMKTVADIGKERIRRVLKQLADDEAEALPMESSDGEDRGFKVFKLQSSCFSLWNPALPKDEQKIVQQLEMNVNHIDAGRSQEDILYELLIKTGFPLSTKIQQLQVSNRFVYSIASGAMLVCLDKQIDHEVIAGMASMNPERVICLDEGFMGNDTLKTNAVQTMKSKRVTSFRTV
jgi:adenine-specific DNA-methyltransferase